MLIEQYVFLLQVLKPNKLSRVLSNLKLNLNLIISMQFYNQIRCHLYLNGISPKAFDETTSKCGYLLPEILRGVQ